MRTLKIVNAKVPVNIVSYNSPDQQTVSFLKTLANSANSR